MIMIANGVEKDISVFKILFYNWEKFRVLETKSPKVIP